MARWDPFRDLLSIQNELNRLFGRTYSGDETSLGSGGAGGMGTWMLTITGERPFYSGVPEEAFHRVERRYGPFARSLTLRQRANPESIQASFDKGVLTIEVPKVEEAKPKKITIKATG